MVGYADIVRGRVLGGEHAYVLVDTWLGAVPPVLDRAEALARLARRYLLGHGPAAPNDLAKWAGITLGDARRALAEISAEVFEHRSGVMLADTLPEVSALPPPRLLGAFDPLLDGWVSREPFLGAHVGVVTVNVIFRPVALVEGRVVATWRLAGGAVVIDPLEAIGRRAEAALRTDAVDVLRFLVSI